MNVTEITILYRSLLNQQQPPGFVMLVCLTEQPTVINQPFNWLPVVLSVIGVGVLSIAAAVLIMFVRRWQKKDRPQNKEITIFSQGSYRKYTITNTYDKKVQQKITEAFTQMEEMDFDDKKCLKNIGDDLGKCAICFEKF